MAGCYIGPIDVYDTNSDPFFTTESIAPDGTVLTMTLDENWVWAIAEDDQEEPLEFYWVIDTLKIIENAEPVYVDNPNSYGSRIILTPEPEYDGRELRCTVRDVGGNRATLSWILEVPE